MAELTGFAVLPADTFADGPPSGNFINTNNRPTPFDSQPVQGFSGVQFAPDSEDGSSYWFLSDNGFGSQGNSADYLLRLYQVDPDFAGTEDGDATVEVQDFIQLADPDNLIPFDIVNEDTNDRLLTGADFDIESFVIDNNGDIWIGEEFGPYILHFDSTGTLLEAPIATPNPIELNTLNSQEPLVIAHRGASGDLPEHTLAAYEAAIAAGADFIEPDLVTTSDGFLIARHEPMLDNTTNVAEVFGPERQSTKLLDGVETTAYFAEDFTLEEIKQLRAVQSRDSRDPGFDGLFEIPTLEEVIELVQKVEAETGVEVGIYPETKHPTFFDEQDLSLEEPLIQTLQDTNFTDPNRIFIQSFEFANLIDLQEQLDSAELGDIPLVQLYGNTTEGANPEAGFSFPFDIRFNVAEGNDLVDIYGQEFLDALDTPLSENTVYADLDSAELLEAISELYAEGAGPWKNNILLRESLETDVDGDGDGEAEIDDQLTGEITSFIEDAHDAGLQVHPYTLRDEERFLTLNPNNTEEFDSPQLIVNALIGIERPGGNAALYSRIDNTQTDEQGNNLEPFFDFTFTPADLILDENTGIVTTPPIPLFVAPELAEEIGEPDLAGTEAGFFIDNFLLEENEETGEFVIVGGSDSGSFNSVFISEDFLNDNDLDIVEGSGTVDPIDTEVDTSGFVGFGFPLSEDSDVRFITDPDTGLLIPTGGAYVAEGSISFEALGTGTPQTPEEEFEQLIEIGADGFFTDFARTGDPVRDVIVTDEVRSPQNPDFRFNTLDGSAPIVIGHRGASGDFPEHTLEAYRLAIVQGADFVEPDLVTTFDGVLIARHEPMLDDTTNVAEVFGPERQSTKLLDGVETTAYFAEDFTLEEIKQLRAVQPRDFRDQSFNGEFEIPTFEEVIELVQEMEGFGFEVGIYPETKHPTFFDEQDLSLEEALIETLQDTGFTDPDRIFIQSFEFANLIDLQEQLDNAELGDIPLVQLYGDTTDEADPTDTFSFPFDIRFNVAEGNDLVDIYGQEFLDALDTPLSENTVYADLDSPELLEAIGELYAEGAGPWKNNILLRNSLDTPVDGDGDGEAEIDEQLTGEITSFIEDAHDAGLQVHPYTLRDEERFLTLTEDGTPQTPGEEFEQLIEIGADGFFTDFPATGSIVVDQFIDEPNLPRTRGYEGMAFSPDRETFYPLLEGAVAGDPENALRIYEFDPESSSFEGLVGFYPTDVAGHAIGDFTPINETEFLVIERDGEQGDDAQFKKIFKIDISEVDDEGFVAKEEVVDLLNIDDPNDLNDDGETTFDFPFVTIENVLVLDEDTILVANDNNYPFSIGRGPDIDNNEIIQIDLDELLNLTVLNPPTIVSIEFGQGDQPLTEDEDQYTLTFNLTRAAPSGGLQVNWLETNTDNDFGDALFPPELINDFGDVLFPPELTNASNLDFDVLGSGLLSTITIDAGATTATVTWTTIPDNQLEGDETITAWLAPAPGDGYIVDAQNRVAEVVIQDTSVGNDQLIVGTPQPDTLNGGTGDDTISGLNGADTLVGGVGDDEIIGGRGNDFLYGQDGDDTLQGRPGFDFLFGGDGNDVLNGGQGRDRINGGPGDDTITGGASIDRFIYNSNQEFDTDDFGVDTILEFQEIDLILLDKSTFTALDSAAGIGFSVDSDFVIVTDDDDVDSSSAFIVYSEESGGLFYNTGDDSTQFAILDGAPTITEDNFQIR
ncbi:glycerophosphodiester phosphodiesterase family protein [Okeania sp. KiyG1]|uniref:glycerophosphodiester phosphodiesterase family protein n=1 Tax=Okeania sp. KiyG1 TaxID=2720165 RepID=UPI0019B47311|nr:glycerophosphodiester phosphodiesterase family protein [Okeania sp. KiyG1]GGA58510.1 hypothetical protein CYANOKiyG1_79740 [Okeania sp. KiyG1]